MSVESGMLTPGTLGTLCYPNDPNQLYLLFCQRTSVQFPSLTGIIISDSQPAAIDRDKAWLKTTGGAPVGLPPLVWFNGLWVARHPYQVSSLRWLWIGAEADLVTFDGGDNLAAGDASGPMWSADHSFDGRVPIGAGAIPSDPTRRSVTVNAAVPGEEAAHALGSTEFPSHTHLIGRNLPSNQNPTNANALAVSRAGQYSLLAQDPPADVFVTSAVGGDPSASNATVAHNNVQPGWGVFCIQRTSRIYYRGA